jgi:two-component system heavy metal sensor histidine kinase CusS
LRYTATGNSIQIAIADQGGSASVRVRNPGPSIPAKHLPQLFDRFYRAGPARSHRDQGHGLGLAIVKAIVQMHGGSVFVRSLDGVTEIGFSFPGSPNAR